MGDYFQRISSETSNKSEIKVYQEFIRIISRLEERDLSETEIKAIETELTRLDLISNTTHNKRFYKKFPLSVTSIMSIERRHSRDSMERPSVWS